MSAAKKFEFLEHTADAKFRAYGKTLGDAFANAAVAMFSIMTDCSKVKPVVKKRVSVHASDVKALLYSFLEELVFMMDTEDFLLSRVDALSIVNSAAGKGGNAQASGARQYALKATVSGDKAQGYETQSLVKAVTYSEMEVTERKGASWVQVVVDI